MPNSKKQTNNTSKKPLGEQRKVEKQQKPQQPQKPKQPKKKK